MVAPRAIDVQVGLAQPLVAHAELLRDPQRSRVLRPDVHLDPVQPKGSEAVVGHEGQRDGDRPAAGDAAVDPVPDVRGAQRTPRDARDGDLPDEGAVEFHDERSMRPARASREKPRTICGKLGAGPLPSGEVASHGRNQDAFAARTDRHTARVATAQGTQPDRARRSSTGQPGSPSRSGGRHARVVAAVHLFHGVRQEPASTATPSRTPPTDPAG